MRRYRPMQRCGVTGKVWHGDRKRARRALKRTAHDAGLALGALEVFCCPSCQGFHIRRRRVASEEGS